MKNKVKIIKPHVIQNDLDPITGEALSCTPESAGCADLPEGLSELRYHLKEALYSINKFPRYNEAGKRYVVEATERSLDQAYKYLKYFQHKQSD